MALSVASRSEEISPSTRASVLTRVPVTPAIQIAPVPQAFGRHAAAKWVSKADNIMPIVVYRMQDGAGSVCSDSALKILFLVTVWPACHSGASSTWSASSHTPVAVQSFAALCTRWEVTLHGVLEGHLRRTRGTRSPGWRRRCAWRAPGGSWASSAAPAPARRPLLPPE